MTSIPSEVSDWLNQEIERHRLWRKIWSALYFTTAAMTIVMGALTTVTAGMMDENGGQYVMFLAAITTILASLEKVLNLREKWDLHRNTQVTLEMIRIRSVSGLLENKELIDRIEKTAHFYSNQLAELNDDDDHQT